MGLLMQLKHLKKQYVLQVIESYEVMWAICFVLECEEKELLKFCKNNQIRL
jgi:hypothetical protein